MIAKMLALFLEKLMDKTLCIDHLKMSLIAFNNGLNYTNDRMSYMPFTSELKQIQKDMTHSLKPYDLMSQEMYQNVKDKILKNYQNDPKPIDKNYIKLYETLCKNSILYNISNSN